MQRREQRGRGNKGEGNASCGQVRHLDGLRVSQVDRRQIDPGSPHDLRDRRRNRHAPVDAAREDDLLRADPARPVVIAVAVDEQAEARCRADLARKTWGKPAITADLLQEERPALQPLPAEAFVAARVEPRIVDSLSLVGFDANQGAYKTYESPRRRGVTILS